MSERPSPEIERAAKRGFARTVVIAAALAALGLLWSGSFFDSYHGVAVGHRPVQGSDGQGDRVRRFVLDHPSGGWSEVVLPVSAFEDYALPLTPRGVPPVETPEGAPTVTKELFSFTVTINDETLNRLGPEDAALPLLFLLMAVLGRNVLVTGSPFRIVPTPDQQLPIRIDHPKGESGGGEGPDGPRRRPQRPKKGPPPQASRRRRKKRR